MSHEVKKPQKPEYYFDAYFSKSRLTHIFHKNRIDKIISLLPGGGSILDAGCGSGVLLYILNKTSNYEIFGVDIRKECVDFASKKCGSNNFYTEDLRNFDLKRKFDIIVCSEVIEHFRDDDQKLVIESLDKHLKNGGVLVLLYPSKLYIEFVEKIWKVFRHIIYPKTAFDDEDTHVVIEEQELKSYLAHIGYQMEEIGSCCYFLIKYMVLVKD